MRPLNFLCSIFVLTVLVVCPLCYAFPKLWNLKPRLGHSTYVASTKVWGSTSGSNQSEKWLKKVTRGLKLRPIYKYSQIFNRTESLFNYHGCIINSPHETMNHALIDMDIDTVEELVLQAAKTPPDNRKKPFVATLRGVGGGKTRTLEELRRNLLKKYHNILPLAISFNSDRGYLGKHELELDVSVLTSQAISIIARILYSVYDISLIDMLAAIRKCGAPQQPIDIRRLIESCIENVVQKVRSDGKMPIDTFILMVDESMAFIEKDTTDATIYVALRGALLDRPIMNDVNTSLVITSLAFDSINVTNSGRSIIPLLLPAHLNSVCVVKDWWLKYNGSDISVVDKTHSETNVSKSGLTLGLGLYLLNVTASILGVQPRVCEMAKEFLNQNISLDNPQTPILHVNGVFLRNHLNYVTTEYKRRYPVVHLYFQDLTPPLMESLVFGEETALTDKVLTLVRESIFTNSLSGPVGYIIPEASLLTLSIIAGEDQKKWNRRNVSGPLLDLYSSFLNYLEKDSSSDIGKLSEDFLFHSLRVMLAALIDNGAKSVSMTRLLRLKEELLKPLSDTNDDDDDDDDDSNEDFSSIELDDIPLPENLFKIKEFKLPDITNTSAAQEYLNKTYLSDISSVRLIYPSKSQPFDMGIVYRGVKTGKMNVIFLEAKSKAECMLSIGMNSKEEQSYQSIKVTDVMKKLVWNYGNKPDKSSNTEETTSNREPANYVYIYMITDVNQASVYDLNTRTIWLGREDVKRFFGLSWNFYIASRAMC